MNKLNIINKIRNKLTKNIINKQWFKKYKKKGNYIDDEVSFCTILTGAWLSPLIMGVLDGFFSIWGTPSMMSIFMFIISTFILYGAIYLISLKIQNFLFKRNIKKSKNFNDKDIVKLINGSKKFIGSKTLVDYIKNQPLEKEDLEEFKNTLNQNFDYNEFKNIFDHPDLNKLLDNKDNVSYEYALTLLNLLESECKNKSTNENVKKMKSMLFEQQDNENKDVVFEHHDIEKNGKEKLLVSEEKIYC